MSRTRKEVKTSDLFKILKKDLNLKMKQEDFFKIISLGNELIVNHIIKNPAGVLIPSLGTIKIKGKKTKHSPKDWYNTKKSGKWCYHTNDKTEGYTFFLSLTLKPNMPYSFRPIRKWNRLLAKIITEDQNYMKYKILE